MNLTVALLVPDSWIEVLLYDRMVLLLDVW